METIKKNNKYTGIIRKVLILLALLFVIYMIFRFGELIRGFQDGLDYR